MKKLFALGVGFIIVLLTLTLVVFGVMHTRYFTPSAQWLTQQLWPNQLSFSKLEYNYPTHFTLHQVTIATDKQPVNFEQVDIWLNQKLIDSNKLVIDSLLLDGANFAQGLPSSNFVHSLKVHQIALHNIDFVQNGLIARGVNLQIKQPRWPSDDRSLPYGEIQLSAEQFYWQGEAFNNVLLDADYKEKGSTIYGASFRWRGGEISGQAEQFDNGWSLINTTISHLSVTKSLQPTIQQLGQLSSRYIRHINSLDILNSNISWVDVEFNNLAASVENINLNGSLWTQDSGYLSLNADSITWRGQQLIDPSMKIDFSSQSISISDFASEVYQGHVQFSGTMTPDSLHLRQLNINGIKWFAETPEDLAWLPKQWPQLRQLSIDQLEINNLQLIQLVNKPFWQLSGVTIEGKQNQLIRNKRWGLWNGKLMLSANSASIGELITTQGVIEMQSTDGKWKLHRAFVPLENGYLDATASWDFSQSSSPWSLAAHADGLPFPVINYFFKLPIKLDGITEFDINAEGLAGDYSMFAHSLSGELNASMRDGTMVIEKPNSLIVQPFEINNILLIADRGRMTLNQVPLTGVGLDADIVAQLDLVSPKDGQFNLNVSQGCETIRYDMLNNLKEIQNCRELN